MATARERHSPSFSADESNLFLDTLHEAPLSGHRQPRSILGSVLYCFLLAGYGVVAAAAPWIFFFVSDLIPTLLCSCNVALLLITGIFQQYWVYQVKKVRLQGYYIFSQKLKHIARLPFATVSYGTGLVLLCVAWQPHIQVLSLSTLLRIVMFVEVICAGCFMSMYIGCIHQYNSLNDQPDVLKSLYSALQPSSPLEDLRYHDGGRLSDQQMALLQYQRENIHYLSEEVLRLQECLSKYEQRSEDGSASQDDTKETASARVLLQNIEVVKRKFDLEISPEITEPKLLDTITDVDLAHLLAARDQELRTLSAEINQVHSELRLARSLIAEKDSENQRLSLANNEFVKESERLRAILNEWSTRAAKLERALEAQRSSNMELQKNMTKLRSQTATTSSVEH